MEGQKVPTKTAKHSKIADYANKIVREFCHTEGLPTRMIEITKFQPGPLHKDRSRSAAGSH